MKVIVNFDVALISAKRENREMVHGLPFLQFKFDVFRSFLIFNGLPYSSVNFFPQSEDILKKPSCLGRFRKSTTSIKRWEQIVHVQMNKWGKSATVYHTVYHLDDHSGMHRSTRMCSRHCHCLGGLCIANAIIEDNSYLVS